MMHRVIGVGRGMQTMSPYEAVVLLAGAPDRRMPASDFPDDVLRCLSDHGLIEFQYTPDLTEFVHLTERGTQTKSEHLPVSLSTLHGGSRRKPLPPVLRVALMAAFNRLVEDLHEWQQTDSITPGPLLGFRLSLDVQFSEGCGYMHEKSVDMRPSLSAKKSVSGSSV